MPCGIAVNTVTNTVYITSEATDTLHVIDGKTNTLVKILGDLKKPRGVAVNEVTNTVYVVNQDDDTVSVIDGKQNSLIDTITVGEAPRRIVVNQGTNTVYVTNQESESVSVINGETNQVVETIPVSQPFEMTIDSTKNKVYVTYFGTSTLTVIDEIDTSGQLIQVMVGLVIAIAAASVILVMLFRKKQVRLSKTQN